VLFLQPGRECRSVTRRQTVVLVALDASRSMSVRDRPGEGPRIDRAREAIAMLQRRLERRAAEHRIEIVAYDPLARPGAPPELPAVAAGGDATRTEESLEAILGRRRKEDLAALVLVSDGADNGLLGERLRGLAPDTPSPGGSLAFFGKLGVPVHAIAVGERESL